MQTLLRKTKKVLIRKFSAFRRRSVTEHAESVVETVNNNRRTALVLGATGIGAFVFGKLFGSGELFGDKIIGRTTFQNFEFIETEKEMTLRGRNGEDIFIIDKESFTGGE